MRFSVFISDLHLSPLRPRSTQLFFEFISCTARDAEALYVLGDLFDYWAGDDDAGESFNAAVIRALRDLSDAEVRLYVMRGNRDLLMGDEFAQACGAFLLPDPTLIDLYGIPTLLMHGDTLCTDDFAYQAFRKQVWSPDWQKQFLAQPLDVRKEAIEAMRVLSEKEKGSKSEEVMDVNATAVTNIFRRYDCSRLIHGHTHRPAAHTHDVDGKPRRRWVLPDWYEGGGYLLCDAQGCRACTAAPSGH